MISRSIALMACVLAFTGCFKKTGKLGDVLPREALGLLRNDFAVLIDLRKSEPGQDSPDPSMSISAERFLEGDFETVRQTLPAGKQILLCCEAPDAVARVARKLNDAGFDVGRVGSLDDWRNAGLPVKRP